MSPRIVAGRAKTVLQAAGVAVGASAAALWAAKVLQPPEVSWLERRRRATAAATAEDMTREQKAVEALAIAAHLSVPQLTVVLRGWSGLELCGEEAVASSGNALSVASTALERAKAAGLLQLGSPKPTPETRRTYACDVGSHAPVYLGRPAEAPRIGREELDRALADLSFDGAAVVAGAVGESDLHIIRRLFRVLGGKGPFGGPTEVLSSEILAAAAGASPPQEPTTGRRHFLLRGTDLAEQTLVPLLAPLMPLAYRYFSKQREDAAPGSLLGDMQLDSGSSLPRLFLSECQLLVSDPGAVAQMWHRDNMQPGLTILFPLTDVDDEVGPTHLLPGTHHLAGGLFNGSHSAAAALGRSGGALAASPLQAGDALVYDARLLHRGLGNSSYSRCRVVLVMRLDMIDTPPPGATVLQTTAARIFGSLLQGLSTAYALLPAPAAAR